MCPVRDDTLCPELHEKLGNVSSGAIHLSPTANTVSTARDAWQPQLVVQVPFGHG